MIALIIIYTQVESVNSIPRLMSVQGFDLFRVEAKARLYRLDGVIGKIARARPLSLFFSLYRAEQGKRSS